MSNKQPLTSNLLMATAIASLGMGARHRRGEFRSEQSR